jgi:ATP-dependent RNA helicase MSS116
MVSDVFTKDTFAGLKPVLSKTTQQGLKEMKFTVLTKTQKKTWQSCRAGKNVLCRAHTGSGKTLGFLLPTVERLLSGAVDSRGDPAVLIISPTRELSNQILTVATALTKRVNGFRSLCVYGGTNIGSEISRLSQKVGILVATPGRLIDHINRGKDEFGPLSPHRLSGINVFILDECDRLMDMGFRPDIQRIASNLTNPKRQTLLFSATVPKGMEKFFQTMLGKIYDFVDCVDPNEAPTVQVMEQELIVTSHELVLHAVWGLCEKHRNKKIIVFSPTARQTQYLASLWRKSGAFKKILEIHSRKSQSFRTKQSNEFRKTKMCIMFSSDVSARGMDYPEVDIIIQIGLMDSKETYIHRLGRSGRAGKTGKGYLVVAEFESGVVNGYMQGIPIKRNRNFEVERSSKLDDVLEGVPDDEQVWDLGKKTYISSIGYYNGQLRRLKMSKADLIATFNEYAIEGLGLGQIPGIMKRTIGKMGMKGVPGIVIEKFQQQQHGRNRGGNRGGRSSGMGQPDSMKNKKRKLDSKDQSWSSFHSALPTVMNKETNNRKPIFGKKSKVSQMGSKGGDSDKCYSFQNNGKCRWGAKCRWVH